MQIKSKVENAMNGSEGKQRKKPQQTYRKSSYVIIIPMVCVCYSSAVRL